MELVFETWTVDADLPPGVALPEGVGRGLARRLQIALQGCQGDAPGTLLVGGRLRLADQWQATVTGAGQSHQETAPLALGHHLLYRCAAHIATLLGAEIPKLAVQAFDDDAAHSPGAWLSYSAGLGAEDDAQRRRHWQRAFELDPSLVAARAGLARLIAAANPEAAATLVAGLDLHDAAAASALGLEFFAAGHLPAAADLLQAAIRHNPDDALAAAALAALLARQGAQGAALDEALLLATHATQRASDDFRTWAALADVYRAQGDFRQAGFYYGFALRLEPAAAMVLKDAAATWLQAAQPEQALPLIQRALALAPGDADNHGNLAFAQDRLGHAAEALAAARRAAELQPQDARFRILLGEMALRAGHRGEALNAFARAAELDPGFTINPEGGNIATYDPSPGH